MNNMKETISSTVNTVTVEVPLQVEMRAYDNKPFEFVPSINELGCIVLTPVDNDVEFTSIQLLLDDTADEQETVTHMEDEATLRQTTVKLSATMLQEVETDTLDVYIDDIGQAVIAPTESQNVFITVALENSLNLITEDIETHNYFGYTLINHGDGWDVLSPTGNMVEEGVATLPEAKILVCVTELEQLRELVESANSSEATQPGQDTVAEQPVVASEENISDITAEVLEEDTEHPDMPSREDILSRFMQGDIALFSESGTPLETYIPLTELDTGRYRYYYDPESDAVVSYFCEK